MTNEKKKSKMKCHICGQTGHNRNACPGVDDGGAAQSVHKGQSTAKNNTGEKKKKGKDKVRAQKMMRGKKKERGQSIDEKEHSAISYPETSVQFHDMLSGSLLEGEDMEDNEGPCALVAGFISSCQPSSDTAYALSFTPHVSEDSPCLLGYAIGIPSPCSTLWLSHINLNSGEDSVLADMFDTVGPKLKAIGPIGLDYREQVVKSNSAADQQDVFRRQLAITANSSNTGGTVPRFIMIQTMAPAAVTTNTESIFNFADMKENGHDTDVEEAMNIDRDLFKALFDAKHLQESTSEVISIVISLADCGLKYSTIDALLSTFPHLYFSLDGRLTHTKQKLTKEYAFDIPLTRLVFATMSPQYPMASGCMGGVSLDSSTSTHVLFIAQVLATIKNTTIDEVLEKCLENSKRILLSE